MSNLNRTLTETALREDTKVYVHRVQARRTSQWIVELRFTSKLEHRIATEPHGMALPEVFAGRSSTALKPLKVSGLPAALSTVVESISLETARKEHDIARGQGILPSTSTRVEYYAGFGHKLTVPQAAEADRIAFIIGNAFMQENVLADQCARIAKTTVSLDLHLQQSQRLHADLAEANRQVLKLEKDIKERNTDDAKELKDLKAVLDEMSDSLLDVTERLQHRDFIGVYGDSDLDKALDLLEPVIELSVSV